MIFTKQYKKSLKEQGLTKEQAKALMDNELQTSSSTAEMFAKQVGLEDVTVVIRHVDADGTLIGEKGQGKGS